MDIQCTICPERDKCDTVKVFNNCGIRKVKPVEEKDFDLTAGRKYDDKKLRYDLIDFSVLDELAKRFTHGAAKYGPNNWQKVENAEERYTAALLRHLSAWRQGEKMDNDAPELTHLSAVLWNAFVLNWLELNDHI